MVVMKARSLVEVKVCVLEVYLAAMMVVWMVVSC